MIEDSATIIISKIKYYGQKKSDMTIYYKELREKIRLKIFNIAEMIESGIINSIAVASSSTPDLIKVSCN
jgi:hypothetical protein